MSTIEFHDLTKSYRDVTAVSGLTAVAKPGRITGFLGPNGAGKSTALKCLLGLATPTSGSALIGGRQYSEISHPLTEVGAVLDSSGFNGTMTAGQNLRVICAAAGIPKKRIKEVLELVELENVINKRTKKFSLGMKQRLSLAAALLGDPKVLVLDEPANGLDPVGIAWLRGFLQKLASEGRTILVSSHQLAEMQHTVNDVVIINRGKLVTSGTLEEVTQGQSLEEAFMRLLGVHPTQLDGSNSAEATK